MPKKPIELKCHGCDCTCCQDTTDPNQKFSQLWEFMAFKGWHVIIRVGKLQILCPDCVRKRKTTGSQTG